MKLLYFLKESLRTFPSWIRLSPCFSREESWKPGRKKICGVMILMVLCLVPLSGGADQGEEAKGEIIQVMKELTQAYNQNHPELLQGLFTETADVATRPGQTPIQGPEPLVRQLLQSRSREFLNGKMEIQVQNIKFFDKNWAWVEAKNVLQGITTPRGAKLPPIEHPMLLLMEKKKKQWRIESLRYFSRFPILRPVERSSGPS